MNKIPMKNIDKTTQSAPITVIIFGISSNNKPKRYAHRMSDARTTAVALIVDD